MAGIDWYATYMNGYTGGTCGLLRNRLPTVMPTDRAAIATAIRMCGKPDPATTARVVRIKGPPPAAYVEFSDQPPTRSRSRPRPPHRRPTSPTESDPAGRLL